MPLTGDSPSIQGDVPGPDPARAPPTKAVARRARLSGGSRWGSTLPRQGPRRGAPLPPRVGRAWSTFGPHPIGAERFVAVSNGASFAQVAGTILGKQAQAQSSAKDEVQVQAGLPAAIT